MMIDNHSSHISIESTQLPVKPSLSAQKRQVTCNCKKTRCLKLYCDCFRFEFYCDSDCNCSFDCANTEKHEHERTAARQVCNITRLTSF
jgi:hypothetical protein